jgi:hypothetical protein
VPTSELGSGAVRARLPDGRWHFQHGPIDLVIEAQGCPDALEAAIEAAWERFRSVLGELVAELALLRQPVCPDRRPAGPVGQRMHAACLPFLPRFVTPMAAVAGSVADEIVARFRRDGVQRACVNNGGDIALHLAPAAPPWRIGVAAVPDAARAARRGSPDARFSVGPAQPWRGVATSGWRGRSFSLGIADSVTVLARDGASADAAATMVANALDVAHPAIVRAPASSLKDDTDLGDRRVTVSVPSLPPAAIAAALDAGEREAQRCRDAGLLGAAVLSLQGHWRVLEPRAALHREAA